MISSFLAVVIYSSQPRQLKMWKSVTFQMINLGSTFGFHFYGRRSASWDVICHHLIGPWSPQGNFWPLLQKLQSVWSSGITKRTTPHPHPSASSLSSSFPLETGGASPCDVMTAASAVSSALSLLAADRCLLKGNIWDPLSSLKWRHRRYSWTRLWPTSKRSQRRWSRSWRRKERSCTMSSVSVENGEASVHPCVYKNNRKTSVLAQWFSATGRSL